MAQFPLMDRVLPEPAKAWLSMVLPGSRLVGAVWLTGGIDHANHAVTLDGAGEFVLRRWVRPNWRELDPDYDVDREVAALTLLERAGANTPRVVATDPTGEWCGVPALLMTRLPGGPPPPDTVDAVPLATAIHRVHAIDPTGAGLPPFEPYHNLVRRYVPVDALDRSLWVQAMDYLAQTPAPAGTHLIHRDYHPHNVLWTDGTPTAIIDWSNASIGHPDMDCGHMRANLAVSYGLDAAERFRQAYESTSGRIFDRFWDVRVIVDFVDERTDGRALGPDLPELGQHRTGRVAALEQMLSAALR
jgi:aminoglycoside phosphotransferase (APT) family kinase protein